MNKNPLDSLLLENQELRSRLDEAEDALRAIRSGEVDALVVYRPEGEQIYTLQGDDYPYRVMVESISEGAASLTKDGTLLFCNSRLAKMLDVPLETLPGSHLKRFFHQKDAGLIERLLEESMQGSSRAEVAFQRQDGESLPVLLALSPILMEDSWGRVMIATDLTTQKRDEEMVAAELLARSVLDQAAQAIVVCDSSGTVIRASQAAAKITGSTPLLHPFDKAFPLVYEKSQDGQDPFSIQAVLLGEEFHGVQAWYTIHQYGMPIYLLVNAVPLRNPSFEIIGCVVTLIDLTERKQAEIALQQANTQLRFFLENITDAYTEFDEMWRWVSINPVAERTIFQGRTAQELIGKVLWDEYPELVGGETYQCFQQAVAQGLPVHFDTHMLIADQWLEVHAYPRNGHLYVYSRDITERKIAEEKVIQSRAQAELQHRLLGQREMERQQIARDIHDGPLQELIGISMALHSEIEEAKDPDVAQNLMAIRASLQKQLGDLRDFAGELRPPALFQFGLRIAIRSHLEAYRKKHPELKIHFEAEKESDFAPPPIRMALYRIYQESLTNIAKHSEASEVWVRYTASPQAYELAIKDNGAGFILPDDWLILARKGHLGLVGLRERAEAFDGQVEINTQPGQGTQILVTIPVPESKETWENLPTQTRANNPPVSGWPGEQSASSHS